MMTDLPVAVAALGLPTWLLSSSVQVLVPNSDRSIPDVLVGLEQMDDTESWLALTSCTPRATELLEARRPDLPSHLFLLGDHLGGVFETADLRAGVTLLAQLATVTAG